jgi:hypothetical protein
MSAEPSQAVFLSYASQDADAARRIAETLRSAGMEVWFDESERDRPSINLDSIARVRLTSEDPAFPTEADERTGSGRSPFARFNDARSRLSLQRTANALTRGLTLCVSAESLVPSRSALP